MSGYHLGRKFDFEFLRLNRSEPQRGGLGENTGCEIAAHGFAQAIARYRGKCLSLRQKMADTPSFTRSPRNPPHHGTGRCWNRFERTSSYLRIKPSSFFTLWTLASEILSACAMAAPVSPDSTRFLRSAFNSSEILDRRLARVFDAFLEYAAVHRLNANVGGRPRRVDFCRYASRTALTNEFTESNPKADGRPASSWGSVRPISASSKSICFLRRAISWRVAVRFISVGY